MPHPENDRDGWLTISQASERFTASTDAVRRAIRRGKLPHAYQSSTGDRAWQVSLSDLLDAGFQARITPTQTEAHDPAGRSRATTVLLTELRADRTELRQENSALRAENASLREQALALYDRLMSHLGKEATR